MFDVVTVTAAPPTGLTLVCTKDEVDETNDALSMRPGDNVNFFFSFTFDSGLGKSNATSDPFYVL